VTSSLELCELTLIDDVQRPREPNGPLMREGRPGTRGAAELVLLSDGVHLDERIDETLDGRCGIGEGGPFVIGQVDLDDALDAITAKTRGHTDVEPLDAVLTLQVGRAGQHHVAIVDDGIDHRPDRCCRSVEGTPGP